MGSRPALRDIAKLANVSEATVDRVLHGRPNVRRQTAERVLKAAGECGYLAEEQIAHLIRPERLRLTVVLPGTANPYIRTFNDELRIWAQARDRGARIHSFMVDSLDAAALAGTLRRLGKRSDAIAFFGVDHPRVRDEVDRLVDAGKRVITIISDITGSRRHSYIGIDNIAAGRTAAFLLARFNIHRTGKVAIVAATRQYRAHVERELGFQELILKNYPGMAFAETIEGRDDPQVNAKLTFELLERHPDLCGIYNVGGSSAGIGAAVRQAGRAAQVALVGHGLSPDTLAMLEEDTMLAVLTHRTQTLLEILVDTLHSSEPPRHLPMQIIFPTNVPQN
jgi:LacI family transcriptional regulator